MVDEPATKRDAALRLLRWNDTAVVEDAATLLVLERSPDSMALLCEVLTASERVDDPELAETNLWVPATLRAVAVRRAGP